MILKVQPNVMLIPFLIHAYTIGVNIPKPESFESWGKTEIKSMQ